MTTAIFAGTVTVANGGTTVTGVDTFWQGKVSEGDLFTDPLQGLFARVTADAASNTSLSINAWPGTGLTADAYEIILQSDSIRMSERTRQLLEQMSVVQANGRGLFYRFSDITTDADPGSGYLRLNNGTIGSATGAYLDGLDANGATVSAELDTWDDSTSLIKGKLWLRSIADPAAFHAFAVTGAVIDGTGYRKLTLAYVGGSSTFSTDDELMVFFVAMGDAGDGFVFDAETADPSGLSAYEGEAAGYLVFVTDLGTLFSSVYAGQSGVVRLISGPDWELAALYTGTKGDQGDQGDKGWSPQLVIVADGARRVFQLSGYVGGAGSAPTANIGDYAKGDGTWTATIGDALDIRGPAGLNGSGTVASVEAGTNVSIDNTDPTAPVVSAPTLVGDSGAGGTAGVVPAPDAGDAAANKFLKADGTWAAAVSADIEATIALLAMQVADNTNVALFLGPTGNRIADSFDTLTYVDVAGATNLDSSVAGVLKPTVTAGGIDANTLLMLHCNGADASTVFTDSSASNRTITAVGNAQIDTAQSKFGGASAAFDGTGDYLSIPDSADWTFGSGNFTIDMYARFTSLATGCLISHPESGTNGWRLTFSPTQLALQVYLGGSVIVSLDFTHDMVANTWYHLALERAGNTWRIYKNGAVAGTVTDGDSIANYTGPILIGSDGSLSGTGNYFSGWIDEVRISNVARWNGAFTPPTAEYTGPIINNMAVGSNSLVAASEPTKMKAYLLVKEVDAAVAGTDYTLTCSRDGGTTNAAMTLTELFTSPSPTPSVRVLEASETSVAGQPSGTAPRYDFETLTNKNVELLGINFYWS